MSTIATTLTRLFEREKHRIVFWYASESGQLERYEALKADTEMEDVEFIELKQNAFSIKRRLMQVTEGERVIVFSENPQPNPHDNWLLDLQLANYTFHADEGSIIATEMGINFSLLDTIVAHKKYFDSSARKTKLRELLAEEPVDSASGLRMAMLAGVLQVSASLDDVTLELFKELSRDPEDTHKHYAVLERSGLDAFYWRQVKTSYGYAASDPSVLGLCVFLCFGESDLVLKEESKPLARQAVLLLKRWKDSETYRPAFVLLSNHVSQLHHTQLEKALDAKPIDALRNLDTYSLVDLRVLHGLIRHLEKEDESIAALRDLLESRRQGMWYRHDERIQHYYQAVQAALDFQEAFVQVAYSAPTPQHVLDAYVSRHAKVDEAYLRFHQYFTATQSDSALQALSDILERRYVNEFLTKLNESWQQLLDDHAGGPLSALAKLNVTHQRSFYATHVAPAVEADQDLFVIISDGLPFSSATRLAQRLESAKRSVELSPGLASIPSYTQLGMASLLPHKSLELTLPGANVLADGKPTQGTSNRGGILNAHVPAGAVAITAADFIKQCTPSAAGRAWKQNFKVFYIYSNCIDEVGEASADNLPAATEKAFEEIEAVLKKISTINGTNAIVTSDHGYLAQMSKLSPTTFLEGGRVEGDDDKSTRRFVLGQNLQGTAGAMCFSASELSLEGDYDIAVPKNILRLRKRGNDGRYAHGGMSLQELVIPMLEVKLRQHKSKHAVPVRLEVTSIPERVTTGQVQVVLYQREPVAAGKIPVNITAAFFSEQGEPLTGFQALTFDSSSAEPREREQKVGFLFNRKAADYSGQTVYFKVYASQESKLELLLQSPELISHPVQMYVAFTSDFDF